MPFPMNKAKRGRGRCRTFKALRFLSRESKVVDMTSVGKRKGNKAEETHRGVL